MIKQRRGSHINCCVYGCKTMKGKDKHLSFHTFPKEKSGYVYITNKLGVQEKVDRKNAWEIKLLIGKTVSPYMRVCSLHFTEADFILPGIECKFPRLKKNAVPSQNLPTECLKEKMSKYRKLQEFRKKFAEIKVGKIASSNSIYASNATTNSTFLTSGEHVAIEGLLKLANS